MSHSPIETYRANAENLWDLSSAEVFSNSKPDHAAVILETFLRRAQTRVFVFCKNMSPAVYDTRKMLEATLFALGRNVRIEIVSQYEPESVAIKSNIDIWRNKLKLPIFLHYLPGNSEIQEIKSNFAIADGRVYRFEWDNSDQKAVACMNDPRTAGLLEQRFASIRGIVADSRISA